MQIKPAVLSQHLQKQIAPLYILIGQDNYLLEEAYTAITNCIKKNYSCDTSRLSVETPEDWSHVFAEANSYSLFAEAVLIQASYEKKTLDAAGKKMITSYMDSVNPRCFIILKAANLPAKQLQWIVNHQQLVVVLAYPLTAEAMNRWIITRFQEHGITFEKQVPALIHQYTQGNMLACAQWIEKIALTHDINETLVTKQVFDQLTNQCDHSAFELIDTCLSGQADKAIQIIRHAAVSKTESVLILWILAQEVRILLRLQDAVQKQLDLKTVAASLKIWPQRLGLYQASLKRHQLGDLNKLLTYCLFIDEQIKSSFSTQVWNSLEILALALCRGSL